MRPLVPLDMAIHVAKVDPLEFLIFFIITKALAVPHNGEVDPEDRIHHLLPSSSGSKPIGFIIFIIDIIANARPLSRLRWHKLAISGPDRIINHARVGK